MLQQLCLLQPKPRVLAFCPSSLGLGMLISAACTNIVLDSMTQLAALCMQLNLVTRMLTGTAERIALASCLMMK